ncbi:MAG: hypothetical protein IJ092_03850 [Atopobiaceae bacterium]|nr:hypothetical protein [Atopobiaceae bacterium]
MRKTFEFENPYYTIEVPATIVFCIVVLVWCGYQAIWGNYFAPVILAIFAIAAFYQLWNLVISHAYPRYVHLDGESITFELWGRQDRYDYATVESFLVRSNAQNGKMFIRAGQTSLTRGRYWISTKKYTDGKELFDEIDAIEMAVHPDMLKARSRRENGTYMERSDEIKAQREERKQPTKKKGARTRNAALGTKAQKKEKE